LPGLEFLVFVDGQLQVEFIFLKYGIFERIVELVGTQDEAVIPVDEFYIVDLRPQHGAVFDGVVDLKLKGVESFKGDAILIQESALVSQLGWGCKGGGSGANNECKQ
jgi:hypothetical protein